jgi:AraC-like DNA-binding protein
MSKKSNKPKTRYLTLDELSPTIHMAACFRWHNVRHRYRIPSHHLLLIESGKLEAKTPQGSFEAKAGDLICFRPTDWNEYGTRGTAVVYEMHFEFAPPPRQRLTPTLDEFGPLPERVPLGAAFEEMRRVFEVICTEISQSGAIHRLRLRAAVHEMLALIVSVRRFDENKLQHLDRWQRLRLRFDSNPLAQFSIAQLAREMGLSRRYFSRVFRQRFGLTPKAYHVHARLREVTRLLRSTDKPIKTIAFEMGFADPRVLSRLFKHHLGVLPSDVRRGGNGEIPIDGSPASGKPATGQLFPINQHLLPPESDPQWKETYLPPKRQRDFQMTVPVE